MTRWDPRATIEVTIAQGGDTLRARSVQWVFFTPPPGQRGWVNRWLPGEEEAPGLAALVGPLVVPSVALARTRTGEIMMFARFDDLGPYGGKLLGCRVEGVTTTKGGSL